MAQKRICIQVDFNGPSPFVTTGTGTLDKRLSLINLARLLRGINHGSAVRGGTDPTAVSGPPSVVVQSTVVQASATATPASVQAADTLSIAAQALTATQGKATGTATAASVLAATTLTVNGVVFTAVNGAVVLGEATFDCSGTDTACATSIAAQFNAYDDGKTNGVIGARSAAAVVTFYAKSNGTVGNAYTLASSDGGTLAVSAATLTGGAALTNNQFDFAGTNITTGADIVRCIRASTTAAIKSVTAQYNTSTGVVTVTAKAPGVAGNAVTFTSSNGTRLAVTGSGFLASGSAGAPTLWTF